MKIKLLTNSLLALLMFCAAALTSCSKDDDIHPEDTFDIHNPEGYFLYVKQSNPDGSYPGFMVMKFMPGQILRISGVSGDIDAPYTVINGNAMDIQYGEGARIVFEGESIWSTFELFTEFVLIKEPESNQLAGKSFSGTYYKGDKSILHQNFFYSFAADGNTVDAGFTPETTERTENYTPVGNIAARAVLDNGDTEFMVLVNGQLKVNYKVYSPDVPTWPDYHGAFTQQ